MVVVMLRKESSLDTVVVFVMFCPLDEVLLLKVLFCFFLFLILKQRFIRFLFFYSSSSI